MNASGFLDKKSSRFLKKAVQNLLLVWARGGETARARSKKVFLLGHVQKPPCEAGQEMNGS
jgi:hypothetical protein